MPGFGKEIASYFFSKGADEVDGNKIKSVFRCNSANIVGKECTSTRNIFKVITSNGYSNLRTHLTTCIPNWQAIYDARDLGAAGPDVRHFVKVDKKSYNIYKWIEWLVEENLTPTFCECKRTKENSFREPISSSSLTKYIDCLSWEVELVLKNILPPEFGLVFDDWDDGNTTSFFGVFVTWWDEATSENKVYLLRLCPFEASENAADIYLDSIEKYLMRVGKSMANVTVIMGNNCPTNISLAGKAGKPFIGCYSDRLDMGVKVYLHHHQATVRKITALMALLSTKKYCNLLKKEGCDVIPVKLSSDKWEATYMMLERYFLIYPHLSEGVWTRMPAVLVLLPDRSAQSLMRTVFDGMKMFESVSLGLRKVNGSLFEARTGFDWLTCMFPPAGTKLSPSFCDPRNRAFESAVAKVQGNAEHQMSVEEAFALSAFLKEQQDVADENEPILNFESAVKRARLLAPVSQGSRYVNLSYMLPASNVVDLHFPSSRALWRDVRKKVTPAALEMMMYLKINRDLWDQNLVFKIRRDPRSRPSRGADAFDEEEQGYVALNAVAFALQLDSPEMGDYQHAFMDTEADGDFWDDQTTPHNFLNADSSDSED